MEDNSNLFNTRLDDEELFELSDLSDDSDSNSQFQSSDNGDELHDQNLDRPTALLLRTYTTAKKDSARKSKQGQLLLVALLENFCMLHDQPHEQNQALFLILCKQLSRMGIIEETDIINELSSVRESYKRGTHD
jgi:hypothetical protein